MRPSGVLGCVVSLALLAAAGAAQAACVDDLKALQARVDRLQKQKPSPETAAAAKILQHLNESPSADEVDCYNAVARARRVLAGAPPEAATAPPAAPRGQQQ